MYALGELDAVLSSAVVAAGLVVVAAAAGPSSDWASCWGACPAVPCDLEPGRAS